MIMIFIIVMLFFGVKLLVCLDSNASRLVVNVVIFRNIYLFRLEIRLIGDVLYLSLNGGNYKAIKAPKKDTKYKLYPTNITLYDTSVILRVSTNDVARGAIIGGAFHAMLSTIENVPYFHIDRLRASYDMTFGEENLTLSIAFTLKFSLIKILFSILHTICSGKEKRREYGA